MACGLWLAASVQAAGLADLAAPEGAWRFARGTTVISREAPVGASWADQAALSFRARLSRDTLHTVRLIAYLVNDDGWWYQSARVVELESASPKAVTLDLGSESSDWVPRGHMRPWDATVTRGVRAAGLKAFCDGEFEGSVIIAGVTLRKDGARPRPRLAILDFEAPRALRVGERCEIRFRLPRVFHNPFDPAEINVQGLFLPPGGENEYRLVPGFFYQRYVRQWEGEEGSRLQALGYGPKPEAQSRKPNLVPAGPPEWRIRFWPDRPGAHSCRILVRTREGEARVPWSLQVEPASVGKGDRSLFPSARPSGAPGGGQSGEKTPVPFSAQSSNPQSPIPNPQSAIEPGDYVVSREYDGHETIYIHRPGGWRADARTPPKGQLSAWRVPLEWTARWGGYGGLGHYNLAVASEFDDLLDEAAAHGVALPLALTCDEPFGERAKFNWPDNPLNRRNSGPLEAPSRFFTEPGAWVPFETLSRYILARWGGHPAVASWELWCTMPANGADLWHARAAEHLATWRIGPKDVRSHHPQTVPPASYVMLNTFREEEMAVRERWMADPVIRHTTESVRTVADHATDGSEALAVTASYPGEAAILRSVEADWHEQDRLALDVFVPADAPNDMRVMVYLRDADLWWYETLLPTYLRPGDWTKLLVDLSGEATPWEPRGHGKVFDRYALQRVRVLGLRIFGHKPYRGSLYIDNLQLWRDPGPGHRRVKVTEARPNALTVPRYGRFELTFGLSETYSNPFDPEVADVMGHFEGPNGQKVSVPAFFYQEYERHLVDGRELLTPKGRPCWKLRFTPTEVGAHTYTITVNGQKLPAIEDQAFDCIPSNLPGFVRRSQTDPRYFELSTGQFFYPIGMNLRSPSDDRKPYETTYPLPETMGTFIYDEYYKRLAANGMNWARIWQCPWWCGLEWTRQWPGFQGLGRYNLENAWRFDYLLDEAARRGIYIDACLTNHGQITIEQQIDRQWDTNPLNAELGEGGPLRRAADFYTDEQARKLFRQRLRYTVARWGHSPHLMAFALFSEMEFTEAYWRDARANEDNEGWARSPVVAAWVGEMAAYVKRIDPFRHLVTTHFSHPWRGKDVWDRPELDYVQSNAYSAFGQLGGEDVVQAMDRYYENYMGQFGRPVLIAEYGGHWMKNPAPKLDAELHAGIWTSLTSHMAGSTGFWWWLHVHYEDRYPHYRAAARFMAGEDRRGQNLRQTELSVSSSSAHLHARALKSDRRAYVWVYHPRVAYSIEDAVTVEGARLDVPDVDNGRYVVEFWNTYTGEVTARTELTAENSTLRIALPTFRNDIALKVKPAP